MRTQNKLLIILIVTALLLSAGFMIILNIQKKQNSKPHFDLWYANHKQLTDQGVKPGNIETSELCTLCHPDLFFSSRASGGITGRFAAGICII